MARSEKPEHLDDVVYDKLYICPVGKKHADDVLQGLDGSTHELRGEGSPESAGVEVRFNDYGSDKQLLGEQVKFPAAEILGRVANLDKLATYLAREIRSNPTVVRRNLRRLGGMGSQRERRNAKSWFEKRVQNSTFGPLAISAPTC